MCWCENAFMKLRDIPQHGSEGAVTSDPAGALRVPVTFVLAGGWAWAPVPAVASDWPGDSKYESQAVPGTWQRSCAGASQRW